MQAIRYYKLHNELLRKIGTPEYLPDQEQAKEPLPNGFLEVGVNQKADIVDKQLKKAVFDYLGLPDGNPNTNCKVLICADFDAEEYSMGLYYQCKDGHIAYTTIANAKEDNNARETIRSFINFLSEATRRPRNQGGGDALC